MKKISIIFFSALLILNASAQSPKNLTLLSSLDFGQKTSGCWHYNDTSGNEYALVGALNGIIIVDITVPTSPVSIIQLPGVASQWHEVKVIGDFAYAVSEGFDGSNILNGVQIIDLRYLPDSVPYKFYMGDGAIANQLKTGHSITANGHYVYVNGHNMSTLGRGVIILDVSDPWNPVYVGAVTNRYCHDSFVRGDTIYTSDIQDQIISFYDISNPASPLLLATQETPGLFPHNSWLSNDSHYMFTADEVGGTPVGSFDVSDFNNITLLDTFYNANFTSNEIHNVRVFNDFLICPSYGSQLTIADISRPRNLVEIANFTTGGGLCWDADPYLNSGNIIATDAGSRALFVFAPTYTHACWLEGIVTDSVTGLTLSGVSVNLLSLAITCSSDFAGEYRTGYADSGSYQVKFTKAGYTSRSVSANLQNGVLTTLDIKLVPIGAGVNDLSAEKFSLYPNPSSKEIFIEYPGFPIEQWQIIDDCGKVVLTNEEESNSLQKIKIDISSLPAGIYAVMMTGKNNKTVKTFLKD